MRRLGDLAGAFAADDMSRCRLREWPTRVRDHRLVLGRRHPLKLVLALAICAFNRGPRPKYPDCSGLRMPLSG